MIQVQSFTEGRWISPGADALPIHAATTNAVIARAGAGDIDVQGAVDHARSVGGPALRALGFHDRARILKALATYLNDKKETLYALSTLTGATRGDSWIDIDGGIGTLIVYAAKGRRELPDSDVYLDGPVEDLSRAGTFKGQHICVPRPGAAVQINAFNFPVWGMLEKFAPAFLAGMPSIVKPATVTCYLAEACARLMLQSGVLPDGALQLITGRPGPLLDLLGPHDMVGFTGSAFTSAALRRQVNETGAAFNAEQDSLNASILGPDAVEGTPEFELFIREVTREMTAKAGQKCTAIRRILVPEDQRQAVAEALTANLQQVIVGDPALENVNMGPLVSQAQRADVLEKVATLTAEARMLTGDRQGLSVEGADRDQGAFLPPMLLDCDDADQARAVHECEAFGPVSTLLGYRDIDHAVEIANRGAGSLVVSVITHDPQIARNAVLAAAPWHGRVYINDRDAADEATGHGSPMPHMTHGGPGRAGGGEELGGIRSVLHHMQRTAVQGSPRMLSAVGGAWIAGAPKPEAPAHPFTRSFDALTIGETIKTQSRTVSVEDIEHFAAFTGDTFYAHMDEEAARANPFFPGRVAHGYLLLSFAAGLFVQPDPGPVLANTGLSDLSFQKPVSPGDTIRVELTVKRKTRRTPAYGEVRWHVALFNQDNDQVAQYELATMNAHSA